MLETRLDRERCGTDLRTDQVARSAVRSHTPFAPSALERCAQLALSMAG